LAVVNKESRVIILHVLKLGVGAANRSPHWALASVNKEKIVSFVGNRLWASTTNCGLEFGYRPYGNIKFDVVFLDDGKVLLISETLFNTIVSLSRPPESPEQLKWGNLFYRARQSSDPDIPLIERPKWDIA
jgi:hypothetical protein